VFTGIVEELGILREITRGAASARLRVAARRVLEDIRPGDSMAVNGVCLTVTTLNGESFTADVMAETLARTNLGKLVPGERVNLERALRLGDRLGGHLVTGHIDGVGILTESRKQGIAALLTISAPREVMRYVVKKGSVAIDGISLTVVDLSDSSFQVSLIPHTLEQTTLGRKGPGDAVNLEADIIGKYVEKFLLSAQEQGKKNLSVEFLASHGFL
jgi:riboflavin synthase